MDKTYDYTVLGNEMLGTFFEIQAVLFLKLFTAPLDCAGPVDESMDRVTDVPKRQPHAGGPTNAVSNRRWQRREGSLDNTNHNSPIKRLADYRHAQLLSLHP